MPVTHIEEKTDLMQTMVHDQFAKEFDPQDRAIQSVAQISDAMFGGKIAKPTAAENIATILELAKKVERLLDDLQKVYIDHRGNLEEAKRHAGDIIENVEGHQRDVARGRE